MDRERKMFPLFAVIFVVLVAAPYMVTSDVVTDGTSRPESVQEVNFEFPSQDTTHQDDASLIGRVRVALRAAAGGPWVALLLPLLLGLGLLQATLFHAATLHVIGALKEQPERWVRWRVTAAGALGTACGAQLLLLAGVVLVALRMRRALQDGSFATADGFSAFYPGAEVWHPLKPFLWATPVFIACYCLMLSILCKIEEKKKRRKEKQEEQLEEGSIDISLLKVTKI